MILKNSLPVSAPALWQKNVPDKLSNFFKCTLNILCPQRGFLTMPEGKLIHEDIKHTAATT
jgi:hypothetical protein